MSAGVNRVPEGSRRDLQGEGWDGLGVNPRLQRERGEPGGRYKEGNAVSLFRGHPPQAAEGCRWRRGRSVVQQKRESEPEARDEQDELADEDDFLADTHLIEFFGI
jgi:hypothetical protein